MSAAGLADVSCAAREAYVLDQDEGWRDRFGRWHVVGEMPSDYLQAVIRFLEQRARRFAGNALYLRAHRTTGRPQLNPLSFPSAVDWMRATVLLKALYATLAARAEPLMPQPPLALEVHETGTGQHLMDVHPAATCREHGLPCVIHAPSEHPLREAPTHWNADQEVFERICDHGWRHPDPDWLAYLKRCYGPEIAAPRASHECDGCCRFEARGCPTCGGALHSESRGGRGTAGPVRSWKCQRCRMRYPA